MKDGPLATWSKFAGIMIATFVMANWLQSELKNDVKDNYLTGENNKAAIETLKERYHHLDKRIDVNKSDQKHDIEKVQWQIKKKEK